MRIGILGASRIAPKAVIQPARTLAGVRVAAVAARDPERARAYAAKHGIQQALAGYDELVRSDDVDAVYVSLPNGLHAEWTARALDAGKHVLCEKPFTSNAAEAREIADRTRGSGLVVMEAFHYRYHPLAERMVDVVRQELGTVIRVDTSMCFPVPRFSDIRFNLDLAGGAMMDAGCYAVHCLRLLGPGAPEVTAARARLLRPGVDRAMTADFRFAGSAAHGRAHASLWSRSLLNLNARVVGEGGAMSVFNYLAPQAYHRLTVRLANGSRRVEHIHGQTTYTYQLRAFAAAIDGAGTNLTPPEDAVVTMGLIDDVYRAAGLSPRG
jgi:predicted dehydrogenase